MDKFEIYQRLKACLLQGGIDIDKNNSISKAEILGYSSGIEMIRNLLLLSHRGAINNFVYPTDEVLKSRFEECDYTINSNTITFIDYSPENIGALCDDWFGVWHHIKLSNINGLLSNLLSEGLTWDELDSYKLRWEMFDGLQEVK